MLNKNHKVKIENKIKSYKNAIPFPHLCIDNLFENDFLENVKKDISCLKEVEWWQYNNIFEKKKAYNNFQNMGTYLQSYFNFVNGPYFVKYLEEITSINKIISDPSLYGGGIHKIERNGKLDIHEDFNYHKLTGWKRKLNLITFLNKNWKEEYGGHTEFWDKNMKKCCVKTLPIFNRSIIFSTDLNSFHGHPEPLNCPEHMERISLATYYYIHSDTKNKDIDVKSTVYKKRPLDKTNASIEKMRLTRSKGRI